jgi:hypothetical protein
MSPSSKSQLTQAIATVKSPKKFAIPQEPFRQAINTFLDTLSEGNGGMIIRPASTEILRCAVEDLVAQELEVLDFLLFFGSSPQ